MAKVVQRVMETRENDWTDAVPLPVVVVVGDSLTVDVVLLVDSSFAIMVDASVFSVTVESGVAVGSVVFVNPVSTIISCSEVIGKLIAFRGQ